MICGAIFDADGTILDSMGIWEDIAPNYIRSLGKDPNPNLTEILFKLSLNEAAEYFIEHYDIKKACHEVVTELVCMVYDAYRDDVQLKPGVFRLLCYLHSRNIPIAVATSSDRRYLEAAFKRLNIMQFFDGIYTTSEYQTNKMSPDIYIKASETFGCRREDIFVFEDACHAAKTAHDAGFKVIGVYDDSAKKHTEEIKQISDLYIESFEDLDLNIFDKAYVLPEFHRDYA